jgi:hypothetical protein
MAAEICEEGAFTREELEVYDAYWDHIRIDLTLEEYEERDKERLKALEDKDRLIEELKRQLSAKSPE